MTEFSEDRVYARHHPRRGAVLIIGAGAVGGFVAEELSRVGISPLWLVDPDVLEVENLVRHPLGAQYVGQPKASSLAAKIHREFPGCEAIGIDADFLAMSRREQLRLANSADVVVAATDNFQCQQRINGICLEAEKPVVFPAVWVDPGRLRDAEVGEVLWVLPGRHTPCYECAHAFRQAEADAQAARGARVDIQLLALTTTQVVAALLDPEDERSGILDSRDEQGRLQTCIYVHGFTPNSPGLEAAFPDPGLHNIFVRVPFPDRPCRACGASEGRAGGRRPTAQPRPPGARRPAPGAQRRQAAPVQPGRTIRSQLVPSAIPALIVSVVLAVVCFVVVVALVAKQRAEAGNPTSGLPANNSPYAIYGFVVGVIGFAVIVSIIEYWVVHPEHGLEWRIVVGLTVVFALILGVLITVFAKHQSASGASGPSAPPSQLGSALKLRCDPDIGGSNCGGRVGTAMSDSVALELIIAPDIYSYCNAGDTLNFSDNHGEHLEKFWGYGCQSDDGIDGDWIRNDGTYNYLTFLSPTHADSGNPWCGPWIIKLRIKDPSGIVIRRASYSTNVNC